MVDEKQPVICELLQELERHSHAAHAIWVAANLEDTLVQILALYMPNLSNRLREKLFRGYGPLSSFSAKIDMAYALDLIPDVLRRDLHVIREIRNSFAHATSPQHFDTEELQSLLMKFSDFDPKKDRLAFYIGKLEQIRTVVRPGLEILTMVKMLKDGSWRNA